MPSKSCFVCKKIFKKSRTVSWREWENQARFCSKYCADLSRRQPKEAFSRRCAECTKVFILVKPSQMKKYCSAICRSNSWKKKFLGKPRIDIAGENHYNWQGGKTKKQELIRKSIQYKQWRIAVFERDNYSCIWCGDNKGGNLEADHIKPFSLYPELRFEISNGRTLCHECHTKTETYLNGSIRNKQTGRFVSNFV